MYEAGNYGCALFVSCECEGRDIASFYAGFTVRRRDDLREIAKFYEGNPTEDYETALAYAQSISSSVTQEPFIDHFWKKIGLYPRGVNKDA